MTTTDLAFIPSPAQGVWHLGPLPLRAYAVCIIAGIVVAIWWGDKRFVARGGRPGLVTDISVWAVPFGIVGGRIYHVVTDNQLYFREGRNPWRAFAIWEGGLGIWGAVAFGALGAYIGCRRYGVPLGAYADSIAPGLVVAQAIGRLGNYWNQELFGSPTTVPWALEVFVRTPGGAAGVAPGAGAVCEYDTSWVKATPEILCGTYHPTFLYELLWNLGVAALIVWADRRWRLGGGRVFALYVAGYTLGRGWIEMLRIDPANHVLGLRINVLTSIVVFLAAVVFLVVRRPEPGTDMREDPALLQGRADDATSDDAAGTTDRTGADAGADEPADRVGSGSPDGTTDTSGARPRVPNQE
ncbi:prolipoprotein diacylglyceryl transferase [Nakamurella deserti]|uniref:prolipoprotein diacylglyceryl transferase n=1 Tax=Nakamurella deserti TaxID=2164074 RepID=UPI000DBE6BF0|nr:prolipoprotein diacylglyceryl transferase [Nakamurella deserti]